MKKISFKRRFLSSMGIFFLTAVFLINNVIVPQNSANALEWSYEVYSNVSYNGTYSGNQGIKTLELTSGNYKFEGVTLQGQDATGSQDSKPAIKITGEVHLYFFNECKITGGSGYQTRPGSAAIEVATGNTVYIHGSGNLTIKGGNASDGIRGASGAYGKDEPGGAGGEGGGGAGAGIGTSGGSGGASSGAKGNASAKACGDVYLLSTGTLSISGGDGGTGGYGGGGGRGSIQTDGANSYGGPGGGGGGGGGMPGTSIGTGGGGGGAGGQGGSSVTSAGAWVGNWNDAGGSGGGGGGAGFGGGGGGGGGGGSSNRCGYSVSEEANGGDGSLPGKNGNDGSDARTKSKGGKGGQAGSNSSAGGGGSGGEAENAEDNGKNGSSGGAHGGTAAYKTPYKGQKTAFTSGSTTSAYDLEIANVTLRSSNDKLEYNATDSDSTQLTATVSIGAAPNAFKYTWYRVKDGKETVIEGANSNTYALQSADCGHHIKVEVSWLSPINNSFIANSLPSVTTGQAVTMVKYEFNKTASVNISGNGVVGQDLTATVSKEDGNIYTTTTNKTYYWYRNIDGNDVLITSSTTPDMTSKYTLTPADIGCDIKVKVTANEYFEGDISSPKSIYCNTITVASRDQHDYTQNASEYDKATTKSTSNPETFPQEPSEGTVTDYGYVEKAIAYGKSDITVYLNNEMQAKFKAAYSADNHYMIDNSDDLILFSIIVDCNNDLKGLNMNVNKDINAAESSKNKDWKQAYRPLGSSPYPFTGSILGDSNTIEGLKIEENDSSHIGLVGIMEGGKISNLTLKDCSITGKSYVGAFVGFLTNGTITSCHTTGNSAVTGTLDAIGGIAGAIEKNSSIDDCSTEGTVKGSNVVGGIVGDVYNSTVESCDSSANILGNPQISGNISANVYSKHLA